MALAGPDLRDVVHDLVAGVVPLDEHETRDKASTLRWVRSGAPLFRIARPATPDMHLCVYFALFDEARRTVLLDDHVKAGLWLFPGGHRYHKAPAGQSARTAQTTPAGRRANAR